MLTNFPKSYSDAREIPSEGQERLIVEVDSDYNSNTGETPKVRVCLQKWANGIGWFNQKSLHLTLEQAAYLKEEIEQATANHKMKSSQSRSVNPSKRDENASGNHAVIPFPAGRTARSTASVKKQGLSETTGLILPFRSRQG
ncbi:MAG: hypothetical protein J0I20_33035 [Chloroflexi bacterium]|nr:hypothetical protein [Chloroflexota bacterium]